jgi:mannose-6-phosphate isomerase
MPADWQAKLLASVLPAAASVTTGDWAQTCEWTGRLAAFYPDDPGVVLALLMNLVRLRPGQALFLSAGRIHAYLHGAGVELMASSDNVLRCGLTAKHIDAPELLRVLDFSTEVVTPLNPGQDGPWSRYPVPIEDFSLNKLTLAPGEIARLHSFGPQILLVTAGEIGIETPTGPALTLARGESAFLAAGQDGTLSGHGELFLASTNIGA